MGSTNTTSLFAYIPHPHIVPSFLTTLLVLLAITPILAPTLLFCDLSLEFTIGFATILLHVSLFPIRFLLSGDTALPALQYVTRFFSNSSRDTPR